MNGYGQICIITICVCVSNNIFYIFLIEVFKDSQVLISGSVYSVQVQLTASPYLVKTMLSYV